ncbi:competence protein ComE [Candidatus Parcubacteria bacterium]|nr:competence protein ComE [Candidatus Parcubacteria bacterium]
MTKLKEPKTSRLSWDEFFMNMAILAAKRTACRYVEAGAVYVDKHNRVISVGYNGPTEGDYHCIDVGCAKVDGDPQTGKLKRCRGAHAEVNGMINAVDITRLRGATLYTATFPCYDCMKSLNNAGIREIIYLEEYARIKKGGRGTEKENEARELADTRGIKIRKYSGKVYINCDYKKKN